GAAALHVPEDGQPDVLAQLLGEQLADLVAADGPVGRVVGAFGDDHDALAPPGRPALPDDLAQLPLPAGVGRPLGDQHVGGVPGDRAQQGQVAAGAGRPRGDQHVGGVPGDRAHQGQVAAVAAHPLDYEAALVAGGGGGDGVDRLPDPVQGRVGAGGDGGG